MATFGILAFANNSNNPMNLQIPSVTIRLDRENYFLWRTTVLSALEAFDLEDLVLDPRPPPVTRLTAATPTAPAAEEPNPDYTVWRKKDRLVLMWLKNTLSDGALAQVAMQQSSRTAWEIFEKSFQGQTRARRMALKVQLQTLEKKNLSMIDYIVQKRSIADSLAANLNPISDEDLISYILNGLDASFLMKSDDVIVDDLVGLLLQEKAHLERQLHRQNPTATLTAPSAPSLPAALTVQQNYSPQSAGNSNSLRQSSSNSSDVSQRSTQQERRHRVTCQLCSRNGHEAIDCWQRTNHTDYPPRRPNPKEAPRQAHLANQQPSPSSVVDPNWYFDSGAIDHVTSNFRKLNVAEEYQGDDQIQVGNDVSGNTSSSWGR